MLAYIDLRAGPQFLLMDATRQFADIILGSRLCGSFSQVMFTPHPNLSDEVNSNIVQSEIEGGVFLKNLLPSTILEIQTQHHCYTILVLTDNNALISGHPTFCREPVLVTIAGSTWGGSMLKRRFVGRGMHLEFCHPEYRTPIVTSAIKEIRERPRLRHSAVHDAASDLPSFTSARSW